MATKRPKLVLGEDEEEARRNEDEDEEARDRLIEEREAFKARLPDAALAVDGREAVAIEFPHHPTQADVAPVIIHPLFMHQVFAPDEMHFGLRDLEVRIIYDETLNAAVEIRHDVRVENDYRDPLGTPAERILRSGLVIPIPHSGEDGGNVFVIRNDPGEREELAERRRAQFQTVRARDNAVMKELLREHAEKCGYDREIAIEGAPPRRLCWFQNPLEGRARRLLHKCHAMATLFIETASHVDAERDERFQLMLLLGAEGNQIIGFCSLFVFTHPLTAKKTFRICQFVVIPQFQGLGLARSVIMRAIHEEAVRRGGEVVEVTVESPCLSFTRMRNAFDADFIAEHVSDSFLTPLLGCTSSTMQQEFPIPNVKLETDEMRKAWEERWLEPPHATSYSLKSAERDRIAALTKIVKPDVQKCFEAAWLCLCRIGDHAEKSERGESNLRLRIKRRLYKEFKDVLPVPRCADDEVFKAKLHEIYMDYFEGELDPAARRLERERHRRQSSSPSSERREEDVSVINHG